MVHPLVERLLLLLMELTMTREDISENISMEDCAKCKYARKATNKYVGSETNISYDSMFFQITFDCKIKDIKQCPVVIHDMSL